MRYKNTLGGNVITFCGTPLHGFDGAFSYLNQNRKKQFINILQNKLPVYYDSDEDIYLKAAEINDEAMPDTMLCAVFNIGCDTASEIKLHANMHIKNIKKLTSDGTESELNFSENNGNIVIDETLYAHDVCILFLEYDRI